MKDDVHHYAGAHATVAVISISRSIPGIAIRLRCRTPLVRTQGVWTCVRTRPKSSPVNPSSVLARRPSPRMKPPRGPRWLRRNRGTYGRPVTTVSPKSLLQLAQSPLQRLPSIQVGESGMYILAVCGKLVSILQKRRYRPELHYMRGPGPKWNERHGPIIRRSSALSGLGSK
jgi:hypothetical protein